VSGNKEQKFSTVSFGRAVKANNQTQAYKIMEFIGKRGGRRPLPACHFRQLKN